MRIDAIGSLSAPADDQPKVAASPGGGVGRAFMDYLNDAVADVSELQARAASLQDAYARGEYENVHDVIIAGQEAAIALDLVLAIRNQVVQAYEEIMRMQV